MGASFGRSEPAERRPVLNRGLIGPAGHPLGRGAGGGDSHAPTGCSQRTCGMTFSSVIAARLRMLEVAMCRRVETASALLATGTVAARCTAAKGSRASDMPGSSYEGGYRSRALWMGEWQRERRGSQRHGWQGSRLTSGSLGSRRSSLRGTRGPTSSSGAPGRQARAPGPSSTRLVSLGLHPLVHPQHSLVVGWVRARELVMG